jgi:ATP-dependent protease ClpP protease subunit
MPIPKRFLFVLAVCLTACQQKTPVQAPVRIVDVPASAGQGGALSGGSPAPAPVARKTDVLKGTDWPAVELTSGEASISCESVPIEAKGPIREKDQVEVNGHIEEASGQPLTDLSYAGVTAALEKCKETGTLRLNYEGKIATDFTALVERVGNVAERLKIEQRILDLDSSGGHVEDAMKAGDVIGASQWTIHVGEHAICHSACVLILAAGDDRQITGKVGIHRMIRVDSTATTRAELSQELREVYEKMKEYLERNGASVAVADLMMTVPNRKLRLLSADELVEYGLDGTNAVQDDLERIRLTRKCGEDFVRRKDEFMRAFERECRLPDRTSEAVDACGLALRESFGFPDGKCPIESPLSAHGDTRQATGNVGSE